MSYFRLSISIIIMCHCVCMGLIQPSHGFHFSQLLYSSELFQTFDKYNSEWLCVQGSYSHLTDFILITYIFGLFQTFDKCIIRCDCVCRGHTAIPQIFTLISLIRQRAIIDKYNSVWLCVQGPYSHLTDFTLISYISELFKYRTTDYVWWYKV